MPSGAAATVPTRSYARRRATDKVPGSPLCLDCYDHPARVGQAGYRELETLIDMPGSGDKPETVPEQHLEEDR